MFTGRRYHATRTMSLPELAQQMRADLAHLKTEGRIPAHAVVSVRVDQKGTGTGSIDIRVTGLRDAEVWRTPGVTEIHTRDGHWGGLTTVGRRITDALQDIHAAYGYDRSDTMTDYFDRRYYGGVRILDEYSQRGDAAQRARQQRRAAANRAARQAVDTLPLRASVVGDRPARVVITDTRTGDEVASLEGRHYTRDYLTTSFVAYLLGKHGWEVAGYRRRSTTNPTGYWSVRRADADPQAETVATDAVPASVTTPEEPDLADQTSHTGSEDNGTDSDTDVLIEPAELDPTTWADLDSDHWAARWVRDTETLPADDPIRIWSHAIATLTAVGYRHERTDTPGGIDHTDRLVTTQKRDNPAAEAAQLSRHAAAVLDHQAAAIQATYPQARPIVLDGTGLSGIRCETRCGALARWSVPNPATNPRTPSRLGYCPACLRTHAHPITPQPQPEPAPNPQPAVVTGIQSNTAPDPGQAADQPAHPDELTILHTAATGTLLLGTHPGDGSHALLTGAGQRWRPQHHGDHRGALCLFHTCDQTAHRATINQAARLLRAAGRTVHVSLDHPSVAGRRERSTNPRQRGSGHRGPASVTGAERETDNVVSVSDTPRDTATSAPAPGPTVELIGISVIAGWFGVTRPAVAHWMERHPNFPSPDVAIRQPKPDGQASFVYGWRPEREAEIREWERSRPGQGAGGGRPWPGRTTTPPDNEPTA